MDQDIKKLCKWIAIGFFIIYFWFGVQKFFPNVSPAEAIATATINKLTFDIFPGRTGIILLAIWEVAVAFLILFMPYKKWLLSLIAVTFDIYVHSFFILSRYYLGYSEWKPYTCRAIHHQKHHFLSSTLLTLYCW